ncbi:creatinase/aminopeptidase [Mitosporidium daphniae]|uniref:Creatinase/aminopeptidase n=1 Tax=Mitosporidium daphniae TaxID=1485682 RepID=A0A098VPJ7_9MICR|nr:creatinase/aminopeptidase [Mitosporidium daphniae]KGG50938.1 creatinase/aminopeptidase [Mitosporidium daphniae]|eukprot:XP_013237365.1 creatinase/aminopeptidase [Mitosporidium daphniae]
MKEAALWTDGRYFLQAEQQLDPKAWILMKSGLPGTPQKEEWIMEKLKAPNSTLGFDPTLVPFDLIQKWKGYWSAQNAPIEICPIDQNLVDLAWSCRPARPCNAVSELALSFCGKSFEDKLKDLRSKIEAEKCAGLLVSSLDEIAWILNWRGSDIDFNPNGAINCLAKNLTPPVVIRDYNALFSDLKCWKELSNTFDRVLMAKGVSSVDLVESAGGEAVKTRVEIDGFRKAHVQDGVALVFTVWLSRSESTAANKLKEFRSQGKNYVGLSFDTISASGPNAAIIHYKPSAELSRSLSLDEIYLNGTTDVTRTLHFGTPSLEEKMDFTRVLKGNLALGSIVFPEKTSGFHLDVLARQFLWESGKDYRHGTGHGVGHYLNVHEGPHGIGFREEYLKNTLVDGMVVTNGIAALLLFSLEPGFYKDSAFGIRIEDIMIVRSKTDFPEPAFGGVAFYEFEKVTMYHSQVYVTLAPLLKELDAKALDWLKRETSPIC